MASGADGVHLPSQSIGWLGRLRERLPNEVLVGCSTHGREEVQLAARQGADYLILGPVFDTPSKRGFGRPLGLTRFQELATSVAIPVIAIGGIDLERARRVLEHGAYGVAGIRGFQKTEDLERLARLSSFAN